MKQKNSKPQKVVDKNHKVGNPKCYSSKTIKDGDAAKKGTKVASY